jgi:hypothetical protein
MDAAVPGGSGFQGLLLPLIGYSVAPMVKK